MLNYGFGFDFMPIIPLIVRVHLCCKFVCYLLYAICSTACLSSGCVKNHSNTEMKGIKSNFYSDFLLALHSRFEGDIGYIVVSIVVWVHVVFVMIL